MNLSLNEVGKQLDSDGCYRAERVQCNECNSLWAKWVIRHDFDQLALIQILLNCAFHQMPPMPLTVAERRPNLASSPIRPCGNST